MGRDRTEVAGLFEQEGRNNIEEQDEAHAEIDEGVVPEDRADHVGQHSEHAGDGLHPGETLCACFALGREVGYDRAGGVEADVDRQIEGQRNDHGGPKNPHAAPFTDLPEEGQREQHERGRDSADEDEGTAPSTPEPHFVADQTDDRLCEQAGQRAGQPNQADVLDGKIVFGAKDPTQRGNLHAQGEAHRGGGETEQDVERIGQLLSVGHGRIFVARGFRGVHTGRQAAKTISSFFRSPR